MVGQELCVCHSGPGAVCMSEWRSCVYVRVDQELYVCQNGGVVYVRVDHELYVCQNGPGAVCISG